MNKDKRAYYHKIHQKLADKYNTDTHTINFIRSSYATGQSKTETLDFVSKKIKGLSHAVTILKGITRENTLLKLKKWQDRQGFLLGLSEDQLEDIRTYKE